MQQHSMRMHTRTPQPVPPHLPGADGKVHAPSRISSAAGTIYATNADHRPSESERRDQRPILRAIYPRGSVCAVILGGGESDSRRLFPLTDKRTLPAIPLAAVYRLIDVPISNLLNSGINKIYCLTQYNSNSLNRYLTATYDINNNMAMGGDGHVEVVAATQGPKEQRWAEGAVDTVRQWHNMWSESIRNRVIEDVLVLPSDQVYRIDFTQLVDLHRQSNADLTLVCRPMSERLLGTVGAVKLGPGARVTMFEEKPAVDRQALLSMDWDDLSDFMNEPHLDAVPFEDPLQGGRAWVGSCGIMLFRNTALRQLLTDNPRAKDFGRELIPKALAAGMKIHAYNLAGYWVDIGGSVADYYRFHMDLTNDRLDFQFQASSSQFYGSKDRLPPTLAEDCRITRCTIGTGCQLRRSTLSGCVIGSRSIVGEDCQISNSVVMGADYYEHEKTWARKVSPQYPSIGIGAGSVIDKAIIDKNARIGKGVQLVNKERVVESMDRLAQGVCVTDGIVVVSKSAVVPDGTQMQQMGLGQI